MNTTIIHSPHSNVVQGRFQRGLVARLVDQVRTWNENRVAIRQLNSLSDRLLQDIGIERQNIAETVRQLHRHTGVVIDRHPCGAGRQEDLRKAA